MEGSLLQTLKQRENQLKDVINNAIHEDTDMEIVSQDQQYLPCHKSLLSLFSPIISHLLSSVPNCVSPTIFLPDFPASHIRGLLDILQYGKTLPSQHLDTELKYIHDIANVLQISLKDLSVEKVLVKGNQEQEYIEKYEIDESIKLENIEDLDEELGATSNSVQRNIQEESCMISANIKLGIIKVREDLVKVESEQTVEERENNKREHLDDTESIYNTNNMTDRDINFPNKVQGKCEVIDIKQEMVELNEPKVRKTEYFEEGGSDNSIKLEKFNIDDLLDVKDRNKIEIENDKVAKKRKMSDIDRVEESHSEKKPRIDHFIATDNPHNSAINNQPLPIEMLYINDPLRRRWLDELLQFMNTRGTPILYCPTVGKQPLDLYRLFLEVVAMGGYTECTRKAWCQVASKLGISLLGITEMTSVHTSIKKQTKSHAFFTLKKQYKKILLPFENDKMNSQAANNINININSNNDNGNILSNNGNGNSGGNNGNANNGGYANFGSNNGPHGGNYGNHGVNYGQHGGNYGQHGGNYGQHGANYGPHGGNNGQHGGNYGSYGGNYGWHGGNYGSHGGNYGQHGGNYGPYGGK